MILQTLIFRVTVEGGHTRSHVQLRRPQISCSKEQKDACVMFSVGANRDVEIETTLLSTSNMSAPLINTSKAWATLLTRDSYLAGVVRATLLGLVVLPRACLRLSPN
jgi:hypothetical protein